MVQRRAIFCDMVFQNELTFRLSSGNLLITSVSVSDAPRLSLLVSQSRYSISRLFFRSFVEPAQREMMLATTGARYLRRRSRRHDQNGYFVHSTEQ